jgi:cytochrome c biogenesis protein ResB
MKQLLKAFVSRRAIIVLIVLLILCYLIGGLVPQRGIMTNAEYLAWKTSSPLLVSCFDALRLTSVYTSPLFYLLVTLFFLNLVLVTWQRIPAFRHAARIPERATVTEQQVSSGTVQTVNIPEAAAFDCFQTILEKRGYRVVAGESCQQGIKNRFALYGSLLFHISFILLLLGGIIIFHTRFSGSANIIEGDSFTGLSHEYTNIARSSRTMYNLPAVAFRLKKITPEFNGFEADSLLAEIEPFSGERTAKTATLDVNRPYQNGAVSVLIKHVGIAPLFEIKDSLGTRVFNGYTALDILTGEEDGFEIPGTQYRATVRFWPDYFVDKEGYVHTRSLYNRNPLFKIRIYEGERLVADGRLHVLSDTIAFNGYTLSYREIHYYGIFNITEERGGWLLVAGFVIALAGLVRRFVFDRRDVYARFTKNHNGTTLQFTITSDFYSGAAIHELQHISDALKKRVGLG